MVPRQVVNPWHSIRALYWLRDCLHRMACLAVLCRASLLVEGNRKCLSHPRFMASSRERCGIPPIMYRLYLFLFTKHSSNGSCITSVPSSYIYIRSLSISDLRKFLTFADDPRLYLERTDALVRFFSP